MKLSWVTLDFATSCEFYTGVGGGNFVPKSSVTRGMLDQVLYQFAGEPTLEQGNLNFADGSEILFLDFTG